MSKFKKISIVRSWTLEDLGDIHCEEVQEDIHCKDLDIGGSKRYPLLVRHLRIRCERSQSWPATPGKHVAC